MDRKEALRALLHDRRRKIDPSEIGWPPPSGPGRRAQGLSQAQVAQLLYKTERWYAQLERGELRSPSPQMLDKVAVVLRMEHQERSALYLYALGHEPPLSADPKAGTSVNDSWRRVVDRVSGEAASICDLAWNVLECNDEFARMFLPCEGGRIGLRQKNLMRWALLCPDVRERQLADWSDQWAPRLAAWLRAAVAAHPGNADLQELERHAERDPVVGPVYRNGSLARVHADGEVLPVRYLGGGMPRVGRIRVCSAQPFSSPGARLIILLFEPGA
ncbi:helix-turn-helix domain-containing protein [Streptomyces sp. NPDC059278]|uniref:helix-turn-helix domain-containing protein n=1 Tax=Streptomyces sp. NPDC059278 TaxID=3346801 RepID=UPI0036B0AB87